MAQSRQRNSLSSLSTTSIDSRKSRTLPQFSNQSVNSSKNSAVGHVAEDYDEEEVEDNDGLSQDRVKTMFMSIWNNVKFG